MSYYLLCVRDYYIVHRDLSINAQKSAELVVFLNESALLIFGNYIHNHFLIFMVCFWGSKKTTVKMGDIKKSRGQILGQGVHEMSMLLNQSFFIKLTMKGRGSKKCLKSCTCGF